MWLWIRFGHGKLNKKMMNTMSGTAREKSSTGIYHIILRGINRQNIFEDEEDAFKFLGILENIRERANLIYMRTV